MCFEDDDVVVHTHIHPLTHTVYTHKRTVHTHTHTAHQNVQTGRFEEGDLVSYSQAGEARNPFGKLHNPDDTFGGQLTELIPQPQDQLDPSV